MLVSKKLSRDLYSSENIVQSRVMGKENTNLDHRIENHPWNSVLLLTVDFIETIQYNLHRFTSWGLGQHLKNLQIPRLRLIIYKLFLAFSEHLLTATKEMRFIAWIICSVKDFGKCCPYFFQHVSSYFNYCDTYLLSPPFLITKLRVYFQFLPKKQTHPSWPESSTCRARVFNRCHANRKVVLGTT